MNYSEKIAAAQRYPYAAMEVREKKIELLKNLQKLAKSWSNEKLLAYARKMHPLLRGSEIYCSFFDDDKLANYLLGEEHFRRHQRLIKRYGRLLFWTEQVPVYCPLSQAQKILQEASGLVELRRVTTYYDSDYSPAVLRPTIADAIIQCPEDILKQVVAFEFVAPSSNAKDCYDEVLGMHVLTTVYYTGVVPQEIAEQKVSLY